MLDHLQMPAQAERIRKAIVDTLSAKDRLMRDLGASSRKPRAIYTD
jgi:hypothetical protein